MTFKSFWKKYNMPTYIKYFLSYLLIVTVLIIGAYFIIRNQLSKGYLNQRVDFAKSQLDNIAEQLNEEILHLSFVDSEITSNYQLRKLRYAENVADRYSIHRELKKYDNPSKLITSIVYMNKKNQEVISTAAPVIWQDNTFLITDSSGKSISFDPSLYLDGTNGRIIALTDPGQYHLIYFPSIRSAANYLYFYVLDTADIVMQMKSMITEEIPAIALINGNEENILGINTDLLSPYISNLNMESGIYRKNADFSICVSKEINSGFFMVSIISNHLLMKEITNAFAGTYLMLIILGIFGILLISVSMRFTYVPLRNLTQKIAPNSSDKYQSGRIEDIFSEIAYEHQITKKKLDNYRISMQKSLLDSFMDSRQDANSLIIPDIDSFFENIQNKKIYVLFTQSLDPSESSLKQTFEQFLSRSLNFQLTCTMLEEKEHCTVFLVGYVSTEFQNERNELADLLQIYYQQTGCMSALSKSSDSPLDIPALYESARYASSLWPDTPVVDAASLPSLAAAFIYPHDKLDRFSSFLDDNNFPAARAESWQLLQITDDHQQKEEKLQNFFVPCILIDMLTVIINHMNIANVDFHKYGNLYYETLYFCRSFPYSEKSAEIAENIGSLLDIFEQETAEKLINSAPFKEAIEECYCEPDFSIAVLAERFQLSVSYMSYQFKKEMNMNFSDYLWMLRLDKAKELLTQTKIPIDDVSISVGYYSSSSFRRKFKSETGLSPSQYRAQYFSGESEDS